jgi:hypothetical protein
LVVLLGFHPFFALLVVPGSAAMDQLISHAVLRPSRSRGPRNPVAPADSPLSRVRGAGSLAPGANYRASRLAFAA